MKKELNPREETQKKMQGITRNEFFNMLNKAAKNGVKNGVKNGSKNGKRVPK
jgi:hypothetical protein